MFNLVSSQSSHNRATTLKRKVRSCMCPAVFISCLVVLGHPRVTLVLFPNLLTLAGCMCACVRVLRVCACVCVLLISGRAGVSVSEFDSSDGKMDGGDRGRE